MRYVVTDQQYQGHARGEVIEAMAADPRVQAALAQHRLAVAPPEAEPVAAPVPAVEPVTTSPAKSAPKPRGKRVP